MLTTRVFFLVLALSPSASALVIQQKESSFFNRVEQAFRNPRYAQDCFTRVYRKKHRGVAQLQNPGAGIGEIVPFETVLKDGFVLLKCIKDEMFYHGDKFGDQKFSYSNVANVSIVHYTDVIPKMDQKAMTPEVCFDFCRTVPDMLNFGILNGRDCYCAPYFKQMAGDSSECDAPCDGDNTQMCGGKKKSSIFEMHMCADTEGDLTDAVDNMEKVGKDLANGTKTLNDMAEQGQKEAADLQKFFGSMGDRVASDLFQAAKVQAGVLSKLAADGSKLGEQIEDASKKCAKMLGKGAASLLETRKPKFTDFEKVQEAEALVADMKKLTEDASQLLAKYRITLKLQNELSTPQGQEKSANRSDTYYDAYYFVKPEPNGKAWARDKSSCGGTMATEPLFDLTEDECAYACDSMPQSCKAFQWSAKGRGMCFLLTDVQKLNHYDMCAKPLEGACKPVKTSFLEEEETLSSEYTSVPFPFDVESKDPNATLFADSTSGLCVDAFGCDGAAEGESFSDCSPMATYECKANRNGKVENNGGEISMSFSGSVQYGKRSNACSVNKAPCPTCKRYSTCSGPFVETAPVKIKKGDVASYTWSSSGATDSYEVFVGLYSKTCGLVDFQYQRGAKQPFKTFELTSPKTDEYYMKFLLASYDGTGGGAVGADMKVKDVKQTKASQPKILDVESKCKVKFSAYEGLSIEPDKSGKCKTCLKSVNKRCLKPDGSFPVPEKKE